MDINPIGTYSDIDENGYIINSSNIQRLSPEWRSALDVIVHEYIQNLGEQNIESIVVRGSVARGEPVDNISDIDTIAIVTKSDPDTSWIKSSIKKLHKLYPFISGFELVLWNSDKVKKPESKNMRFVLKTQAVTIWGKDIIEDIESVKPDTDIAWSLLRSFPQSLDYAYQRLENSPTKEEVKKICIWICKRIVRAGFYLVMPRAKKFTKDLYPSYKTFSEYYPAKEAAMKRALEYCLDPTGDKDEMLTFISDFGNWLNDEKKTLHYQEDPNDTWDHNGTKYRINTIFKLTHDKPTTSIPIRELTSQISQSQIVIEDESICGSCYGQMKDLQKAHTSHQKRVLNTDYNIPIIVLKDGSAYRVVDGIHRLEKASDEGLQDIPAQEITMTELEHAKVS